MITNLDSKKRAFGATGNKIEVFDDTERDTFSPRIPGVTFLSSLNSVFD